jgi:hypothetical protein
MEQPDCKKIISQHPGGPIFSAGKAKNFLSAVKKEPSVASSQTGDMGAKITIDSAVHDGIKAWK